VTDRAAELRAYHEAEVVGCTRCPLHAGRTQVVVGNGDPTAELMLVGEAPGYHEDRLGVPFVGQAGKLLDRLLAGIGLTRADVFVANVLKCRPPGNRDPAPGEIEACESHLFRQISIIRPRLVCTLGNFATKLLSGRPQGISRMHGREIRARIGDLDVVLYPLFHPAAALYTPSMLSLLEEDFARIPTLLAGAAAPAREDPRPAPPSPAAAVASEPALSSGRARPAEAEQLGLF